MGDIELVIKVPEALVCAGFERPFTEEERNILIRAIGNSTPLPKGHGRLIDADRTALLSDLFCYTRYTGIDEAPYEDATKALEFAPTIIEADKAERSDKDEMQ